MAQTVDEFVADFQRRLDRLDADLTEPLEDCAEVILEGVADNFRRSQTAGGEPWPSRKDPGPKHPLLILSGDLMTAAMYGNIHRIAGDTLELGVSHGAIPYAATHQEGDLGRNIKQREYMAVSDPTVDRCCDIVADHMVEQLTTDN